MVGDSIRFGDRRAGRHRMQRAFSAETIETQANLPGAGAVGRACASGRTSMMPTMASRSRGLRIAAPLRI
ncbi:MAG TPA: hypothetical protein VGA64_06000 [Candidatus Polarisedimenticolia bacterium]